MRNKKFNIKKDSVGLKIEIDDKYIITSWLHYNKKEYTNHRRFPVEQLQFSFDTLKPQCNVEELFNIEKFMFDKPEINQLSLF
jgi:hypothetical protein